MRVLLDYRPALKEPTGVGEYAHQLVKALLTIFPPDAPDCPLELTMFSSSWKDRLKVHDDVAGAGHVDLRIPVKLLNLAWHRLTWPPAEMLTGGRFDVTHSLHPLLLPSRSAAHVITIHDLNFLTYPDRARAEIRRDYPALARSHAQRADRILVPSRFTSSQVEREFGVPTDRISVCSPGAPDWTPRRGIPPDGYVLFFGTLAPRKNVGALLDAYERLLARRRMPPLVLAGGVTEQSHEWVARLARPPLNGVARHIGYVEPDQRRQLYEGARLLVQPSFEEGFGIPVLEAMTVGVPVVAANRGALPEVLGDAGILVNPDNPDDLPAAIERMLDDESFAAASAEQGVARARRFSWIRTARIAYEGYRAAIEHRLCASA